MSGPNGHMHENSTSIPVASPAITGTTTVGQFSANRVKELVAALEVPFHRSLIEWRVTNTTKNQPPVRGQVISYADQRAYTDRLNALFTPAGWTRRYTIHTSANFERSKDQKLVAKVLVTCELTIFGLGSHSATQEKNGPTMTTPARPQKPRRSSGPALVSALAVICITSGEPGSTWTTASDPRRYRN
jgi:Rad52/22 family double-strand break repair protein